MPQGYLQGHGRVFLWGHRRGFGVCLSEILAGCAESVCGSNAARDDLGHILWASSAMPTERLEYQPEENLTRCAVVLSCQSIALEGGKVDQQPIK